MDVAAEKIHLASWILNLEDDAVVQKVSDSIAEIKTELEDDGQHLEFTSYTAIQNTSFDFDTIKKKQNITPFKEGELDKLIQEAAIQEPIEVLLDSID